ncbi:MAG TPA: undecaprenyl-diphosphate phosphatase [Rhizomicrobium sp.]|jgi:undecaprenyl-diphosphatase|nr:undecaprenyl-diphosphate phosphatase [Rhizomicrobium sp.]
MHDMINAVILGIVEGLTEFLPVSSTAHLLVTEKLLGLDKDSWEAFTVVIQLGAVLSVVAVYFKKFWDVLVALPSDAKARQFAINIIVAFLPAAVLGAALIKTINTYLLDPTRALPVIAASWIVGGILILIFERIAPPPRYTDGDHLPLWKALQIGFCQCLALLPGVSRSGATILGAELLGVERKAAAHFTFYLAVPTMLGASVFELYQKWHSLSGANLQVIGVGFVVSFIVALFVVRVFIAFIGRYGLKPFGWYRIAAGLALIAFIFAG